MKSILMILLFLNFIGLYSQQDEIYTSPITTMKQVEVKIHYSYKEMSISKTYTQPCSLAEYEAMIRRHIEFTGKLIEQKERIQNKSITKIRVTESKKDLVAAKFLYYRVDDFTKMYQKQNYPLLKYFNVEALSSYHDFLKIVTNTSRYASL